MTNVKIKVLVWDNNNREHIKKHNVSEREVHETGKNLIFHKRSYKGRYLITGRSGSRLISVALTRYAVGKYYPVTARDASRKERRRVYEIEKEKQIT